MHCVSEYPSKFSTLGFNNINELNKKYKCIIGYSDHSGSVFPILYAISKGVPVIEFHVKINEDKQNIDRSSSINIKDLSLIAEANNAFDIFKKKKINKKNYKSSQKKMLKIFSKSLSLRNDKKVNEILSFKDLTLKKYSLPYKSIASIFSIFLVSILIFTASPTRLYTLSWFSLLSILLKIIFLSSQKFLIISIGLSIRYSLGRSYSLRSLYKLIATQFVFI
jgi:hypothetical protein